MKLLIACEWSGRVRDAFIERGHDVLSCDLQTGRGIHTDMHYKGNVLKLLYEDWDAIIAFPPCDYLSKVAEKYYHGPGSAARWEMRHEAMRFVQRIWDAPSPRICIENPIGYLSTAFMKPTQYIEPYYFGDPYSKKTCLWLKGLEPLYQDRAYKPWEIQRWVSGGTGTPGMQSKPKYRGITFPGVARAMAEQWG